MRSTCRVQCITPKAILYFAWLCLSLVTLLLFGEKVLSQTDSFPAPDRETVILVHGFFRTDRDMRYLEKGLEQNGYRTLSPELPTTFGTIEACTLRLEAVMEEMAHKGGKIHFVGYSMGGLIIRHYLVRNRVAQLGRVVLIATPNQGSPLASAADRYFGPLAGLFDSLDELEPGGIRIEAPLNRPPPEIGAIAGRSDDWSWGNLVMEEAHDGRVPLDSVPFKGMTDFIVLPYDHHEIHHRQETVEQVRRFLETGSFDEP